MEKEMQATSVFLPWEPHEHCEKAKKWDTERWTPQVGRLPYDTGKDWRNSFRKNEEAEPKQNNAQLWMWLVWK